MTAIWSFFFQEFSWCYIAPTLLCHWMLAYVCWVSHAVKLIAFCVYETPAALMCRSCNEKKRIAFLMCASVCFIMLSAPLSWCVTQQGRVSFFVHFEKLSVFACSYDSIWCDQIDFVMEAVDFCTSLIWEFPHLFAICLKNNN